MSLSTRFLHYFMGLDNKSRAKQIQVTTTGATGGQEAAVHTTGLRFYLNYSAAPSPAQASVIIPPRGYSSLPLKKMK